MIRRTWGEWILYPLSLLFGVCFSLWAAAGTGTFTSDELKQIQDMCLDSAAAPVTSRGKRKVLLYHMDGYIPAVHADLPDSIRADDLDSAAAVLCLEDNVEEIEVCKYSILFNIPRQRHQFIVDAVPLAETGTRVDNRLINGSDPITCDENKTIDNTITSIDGDPVSANDILDFLSANNLDWEDNDRDGLRNLEEFKLGTDANDVNSPAPLSSVTINGGTASQVYEGESAEIVLDLFPGPFLGRHAQYIFWADMPDGLHILQYPAGFVSAPEIDVALEAPLVRLLNFKLLKLNNLARGDYQFHFRAADDDDSIGESSASLTVVADDCRETAALPLAVSAAWQDGCKSVLEAGKNYLARYYTFSLGSQTDIQLELDAGGADARIILRAGNGRSGQILDRSESFTGSEILLSVLDAGDYTLEVILNATTAGGNSFQLNSTTEDIPWQFTEITQAAGFNYTHGYLVDEDTENFRYDRELAGAGVAAGDYNQDGWVDLYVTRGTIGPNLLFRNMGDGTFTEVGVAAGVALDGRKDSGASFGDIDGDGWPDLFVGGVNGDPPVIFRNKQNGTFEDITATTGLGDIQNSYSAAFGDYDLDGDLDVYISHWNDSYQRRYLFNNDGTGFFTDVSDIAGIPDGLMADYTPNFSDINNDGWPDLLIAADFNTSQIYINNRDGTFTNITPDDINEDNGMGAAVGDFDNDGDLDWFISSIYDPNGVSDDAPPGAHRGNTGNRLYANEGDGTFKDVTEAAGVRIGGWGWGSCFADFDNDGYLDIFHVNGFITEIFVNSQFFLNDPSRMFISNHDGTFDGLRDLNLLDTGQGRGLVCFDFDRDGDIDIFVANNQQPPAFYRNDGGNDNNFLHVKVMGEDLNSEAIGARVYVTTGKTTQLREISGGNNFQSNNPAEAYFGLGDNNIVDELKVVWPSGFQKTFTNVNANQMLTISK